MKPDKKTALTQAAEEIQSTELGVRISAAKTLLKEAHNEFSGDRKAILETDRVWTSLLAAIQCGEPKLIEPAVCALSAIIGRYRRDLSAFKSLEPLTKHKKKEIRMYAARAIGYLPHPNRWDVLIRLLSDTADPVKRDALLPMTHQIREMPAEAKAQALPIIQSIEETTANPELKMLAGNVRTVLSKAP